MKNNRNNTQKIITFAINENRPNRQMPKLFLVVPCFNEADMLPVSIPRMLEALDAASNGGGGDLETGIILADDGSTDGTCNVAENFPDKRVKYLPLAHSGQQGAILGGCRFALEQGADAVITLDADLQDDPAAIPEMVQKWQEGKDVVYGVRSSRSEDSAMKKATAWLFYALMHLADKRHIPGHADFRLMSRNCIEALLEKASPSGDLIRNLVPTLGFDSARVLYARGDRSSGESKYNLPQMLKFAWKGLIAQAPVCMFLLCLITFAAFFLTSIDSPVHDNMSAHGGYIRHDSAWYFMCGKAWMNGLIPYVDFADSKGPLLWLFYAVAYLISPRSWTGVFWINAIAYLFTSCLLFKASQLITNSTKKALQIGILLNVVYFIPLLIFDDKAEAVALPFVALSMLMACKSLFGKGGSFFWWGFAFGALVMIKYNVAAMTGIFFIAMVIKLRGWRAFFRAIGSAIAGFAVPVVPILAYFLWVGAADDFINEYFVTTFVTINNIVGSNDPGEFLRSEMQGYIALASAGALTATFVLKKHRWFPMVALVWFFLCLGKYARTYYFIPVNVLMVFTALGIISCFEKEFGFRRYIFGPVLAAALVFFWISNSWTYQHDYFYGRKMTIQRERPQQYIKSLAREHNPRVLYWGCGDHGYGIEAEDLPACKYWALQAGATQEMMDDQDNAVEKRLADFVLIKTYDNYHQQKLLEVGYFLCPEPEFGDYTVFSKKKY